MRNIFILTTDGDNSSYAVIDWIKYLGGRVFIFDMSEIYKSVTELNIDEATFTFQYDGEVLSSDIIDSVWYRRSSGLDPSKIEINQNSKDLLEFAYYELKHFNLGIWNILKRKKILNDYAFGNGDKLEMLLVAKKIGLLVPRTRIVTELKSYQSHFEHGKRWITKPIFNVQKIRIASENYLQYTAEAHQNDVKGQKLFPTLLQERIEKESEIRVFYMEGKIWSMCIFSQLNEQTIEDFRRYPDSTEKPNKYVPFKLPRDIENKINLFMNSLDQNCGSLDFILGVDGKFYFLELNPVGQFGMVSAPCNYNLEYEIAKYLMN